MDEVPAPALPSPPELGPAPSASGAPPRPRNGREEKHWDSEGRVHPTQYLTAGFAFDNQGILKGFSAHGADVGNPSGLRKFLDSVNSGMSDAEIIAALKNAGAKYGPNEKVQFEENLPTSRLEPFLGRLSVVSVSFLDLSKVRADQSAWPYWTVKVLSKPNGQEELSYVLTFESFEGDLVGLQLVDNKPHKD